MLPLEEIQEKIFTLAEKINAPISNILTFGISRDDGTPCIQIGKDLYYYFSRDRNTITFQKQTSEIDELLYWAICGITSEMADEYAKTHAIKNVYSRRIKFSYQLELLGQIDMNWSRKREREIEELLLQFPYTDREKEN